MKKILASLFLVSFLAVPAITFAQEGMGMIEPGQGCMIKHDLSDYDVCCGWDPNYWDGPVRCLKKGADTAVWSGSEIFNYRDLSPCCLIDKILTIGDWIFTAILVVAILVILLAAWGFLTASGEPDKVKNARNYLIYGLIGVAVAFLAKVLVRVVASIMT